MTGETITLCVHMAVLVASGVALKMATDAERARHWYLALAVIGIGVAVINLVVWPQ